MAFIPDKQPTGSFVPDTQVAGSFVPDRIQAGGAFRGAGFTGEWKPTAGIVDVPGIAGRGLVRAELGVAKGVLGTLDAMLNIPKEKLSKIGGSFGGGFEVSDEESLKRTAPIREARRRVISAQNRFDVQYSGGLAWGTRVVAEAIPYMANAMAAGAVAGPIGAATVGFIIEGDNAYDEAIASGATEAQANTERIIVGSINAGIEALQIGRLLKFSQSGKHSLKAFIKVAREKGIKAAGGELKGFTAGVLRLSIENAIEEFVQEGVSMGTPAILRGEYPKKADGSPDYWGIANRLGEAAAGGALAGPILGVAGQAITGRPTTQAAIEPTVIRKDELVRNKYVDTVETKGLPAVKKGDIRLYRGQSVGAREGAGTFFTPFLQHADNYALDRTKTYGGPSEIAYIDLPHSTVNQYASSRVNEEYLGLKNVALEYVIPELAQTAEAPTEAAVEDVVEAPAAEESRVPKFLTEDAAAEHPKPFKEQYKVGHDLPEALGMKDKERRAFMVETTGKSSMKDMSPAEAQKYIDALYEMSRDKFESGILPSERGFKKPINPLTPQLYKAKILGVEFMTNPAAVGKRALDLEATGTFMQLDKMERVINKLGKESRTARLGRKIKNLPTKSVTKFAELLNEHEDAPENLSKEEKDVFNYFRNLSRTMFARENEVRSRLDIKPIPYKAGYVRHVVDTMSQEIMEGRYPMPEELKYWAGKNVTAKINNPMEYQRKLGDELGELFSKDLIRTSKAMVWTGLREIHLSEPLKFFKEQMGLHSEFIPAPTRRWAEDFIKHMVKGEQTNVDQKLNDYIKEGGIGKVINRVLKPFGRRISYKPATNLLATAGRYQIYGVMGTRPKQLIRNKFQFVQNLAFSTTKNAIKGFIPSKQAKELMAESQFLDEYLTGSGFENLRQSKGRLGKAWMASFRYTAIGNASRAMKVVYRDRLELVESPKYKEFGWADPQRTYTEPKEFLYPSEKKRIADEMDFCAAAAQYNYTAIAAPEVFKYKAATPLTRLQSWWMNHFFLFHREATSRLFTGKTREGLKLPWSRRIGWGRYMLVGGVVLNTLGYASSFAIGAAPEGWPPLATLLLSMYGYVTADDERGRKQSKRKFTNSLKTFIPGYLAAKDVNALLETDDWTKLLFYNKGIFKEDK